MRKQLKDILIIWGYVVKAFWLLIQAKFCFWYSREKMIRLYFKICEEEKKIEQLEKAQ